MATQRWTDEMLDELASSVSELSTTVSGLSTTVSELSTTVSGLSTTVSELSTSVAELRQATEQNQHNIEILVGVMNGLIARDDQRGQATEQNQHNIEILVGVMNGLIARDDQRAQEIQQIRIENEQYKRENDQRFNVLLDEVRYLIRRLRPLDELE